MREGSYDREKQHQKTYFEAILTAEMSCFVIVVYTFFSLPTCSHGLGQP